ncbi:MAG: hypothetical protein KF767_02370 [Bdellovibrionaceae bacterium]|nr:hypothetical protein [Pseudobdellovibrionaceae bacterium]
MLIRIFLFLCLFSVSARAAIQIPSQMSSADRQSMLKILGYGTSFKTSGDPYPLGGYMGFEVGVSYELLSTAQIAKLGSGTGVQGDTSILNVTLGKGLFYDVDFYLNFSPLGQSEKFSSFGGALRWGVLELQAMPIHFSVQAAANSASFQNKVNTTTQSFDLIGGWNFQDLVFYGGVGLIRSSGQFIGGAGGVSDSNETVTEAINEAHTFAGISVKYGTYFVAAQMDRATQAAYAIKFGVRY